MLHTNLSIRWNDAWQTSMSLRWPPGRNVAECRQIPHKALCTLFRADRDRHGEGGPLGCLESRFFLLPVLPCLKIASDPQWR